MKLTLLRHSITRANLEWLYCGTSDLPLAPEGVQTATELAQRGAYPDLTGVALYTSGMLRAEQTFQLLFGARSHGVLPGFREMAFGDFELCSYEQLKETPAYQTWISGDNEANPCPGGESGQQMAARVQQAAQALVEQGEDALVVCHGGPIAALMAHWFPEEGKSRYQWQPSACRGYEVQFEEGKPTRWRTLPEDK